MTQYTDEIEIDESLTVLHPLPLQNGQKIC